MFEAPLPQTTCLWQRAAPQGNHLHQRQGGGGLRQADTSEPRTFNAGVFVQVESSPHSRLLRKKNTTFAPSNKRV